MKKYTAKELFTLVKNNESTFIHFKHPKHHAHALNKDSICELAKIPNSKTNKAELKRILEDSEISKYNEYILSSLLKYEDGPFGTESLSELHAQMEKVVAVVNQICEEIYIFHENNHDVITDEFIEKFNS